MMTIGGQGPTFAIKDSIDVAGHPTRLGSLALEHVAPAGRHADVVEAILAAGGRIVAKAKMHELAYGVTGVNAGHGTPINPRWPDLIPGGSSSGSAAAVAGGEVDLALGTDTGGSIRVPAACCGVFGLKPSLGRIARGGVTPERSDLDSVGPIAPSMAGIQLAMTMIDPSFDPCARLEAPTLGRVVVDADDEVLEIVEAALAWTGLPMRTVVLPDLERAFQAGLTLMAGEAWSAYGHLVDDPRLGADVAARLRRAATVTPDQLAEARAAGEAFARQVDDALKGVEALVLPTLPFTPLSLAAATDAAAALAITRLVRPFNVSGHPALTIPLLSTTGLPVGLQIIGRRQGDDHLCAIGERIAERLADLTPTPIQRDPAR
ncbi:amidase [Caulobacter sp. 602-1]|nr:amidase [Caulobacter sp. 602-1]